MNQTSSRKSIGEQGEKIAVRFLKSKGIRIIETNFTCKRGEIDIIAKDRDILVFIEVKTRTYQALLPPHKSVTRAKEKKILSIADYYVFKKRIRNTRTRFDIISIVLTPQQPRIQHFRAAFGTWLDSY